MRSKQIPKHQTTFFEPSRVFLALLIAVLFFLAPINRGENESTAKGRFYSLIAVPCAGADDCPNPCKVWYCGHKIPGGPCLEWTYHCAGCDNGGGGTYVPPTISHTFTCTNNGVNDWCTGNLTLNLTATDPQGQTIIVSGEVNGSSFVCPGTDATCQISLPEGAGLVSYRVDSLTGLSATGTTSYQLDATTPEITGAINASLGMNGWYNSQVFATASASDALSGLASLEVNIDNIGWASYSDTTFADGMHTIQFRASDNAGNVTETAVQVVNVDTTAPTLSLAATGTIGESGWYVSAMSLNPTASDELSGLAALEATTDGVTWNSVNAPITLGNGTYTVQFRATDQAGNVSLTPLQQVNVDATTPSLSLEISGTKGQNGWYVTHVSVTPNASDAGAGINKIEAAVGQGAWTVITNPLSFADGVHSYQIRVTDHAGNVTETPVLSLMVDTIAPAIAMDDDTLNLGDTLYYDLEDLGSGLWINRTVIEDDDEKYKKVVWLTEAVGQKANGEIRWNGIFADGTRATLGEYFITLKISDRAGNETMRTAVVKVTALSALIPIPAFTPPTNLPLPLGEDSEEEETQLEFGGMNNGNTGGEAGTVVSDGQAVVQGKTGWTSESTSFSSGNRSANVPVDASNILWGAAAAAVLGMTLADWQRKREEEAARLAAERANEVPDDVRAKRREKVIAKNQAKRAQEEAWEAARQAKNAKPEIDEDSFMQKTYKQILSTANVITGMSTWKEKQEIQTHQNNVSAARWAGVASVAQTQQSVEPSKWEQIVNRIDQHQPATSVGAGALIGLATVAVTLAVATVTLPVILTAAAIAAVATAVVVASGTVALNNHFDRPPTTNIVSNVLLGVGTALLVTGGALAVAAGCATPAGMPVCAAVPPVVDSVEQTSLHIQYIYQVATNNPQAGQTYIELQLEQNDGGAPGNTVFANVAELISTRGDEVAGLIKTYGDEGIAILTLYGEDAVNFVSLATKLGINPSDILSVPPKPGQSLMGGY